MARVNVRKIYMRFLECPNCGKINRLWSKDRKKRPIGHIKTMCCFYCAKEQDMVEIEEPTLEESAG